MLVFDLFVNRHYNLTFKVVVYPVTTLPRVPGKIRPCQYWD